MSLKIRESIEKKTQLSCTYCKERFHLYSSTVHCEKCRAVYHDTCWRLQTQFGLFPTRSCATFGCDARETIENVERYRRAERLAPFATLGILLGCFVLVTILLLFRQYFWPLFLVSLAIGGIVPFYRFLMRMFTGF